MNWLNTIFILALAYLGVFMEGSLALFQNFIGAQISLLPALMVYAALTAGLGSVTALAVCGGLWLDSFSANRLGVSVLPLFLIGFIILGKRDLLLREHQFAQAMLGLAAGALFPLGTFFLLLNLGEAPLLGWQSLWQWVVGALSSAVLTPLCFWLFARVHKTFAYPSHQQSSFRDDREIKRGRS